MPNISSAWGDVPQPAPTDRPTITTNNANPVPPPPPFSPIPPFPQPEEKVESPAVSTAAEKQRQRKEKMYDEQEARRARPLMPDTLPSLITALVLAAIGLITSFVVSYSTLVTVAEWMKIPWAPLDYVVPGFVETLILFSSYDLILTKSRGGKGRSALAAMIAFSAVACIGNGAHALFGWLATGQIPWEGYIGVGLAALTPLVVVYLSKRISGLVFAEPIDIE